MFRAPFSGIGLLLIASLATSPSQSEELKDLYFGEALYYAHQGYYFEALERLDTEVSQHAGLDEPELDTLYYHIDDAEFSLGDFELRYRMHHRAGRAITAVLEGAVDEIVRNDAAYRLARIHFQKGQMEDALLALDRIDGKIPEAIRDDIEFLRANVYLSQEKPAESFEVLKRLQGSDSYGGFAAYNLGIAYLQDGQRQSAIEQLDRAGQVDTDDPAELAIRDKANLVLGTILLEDGEYELAMPYLNRVRLDGPFSNQALLSAGWASLSAEKYERAVVPWRILAEREVTDGATQEAMLALPYAYGKLDIHGRAAIFYGRALDAFGAEVDKLNESIESIREGKFLGALVREEIRKDKDWVIHLRSLPETPETYYLMELLATHDFQTGLQNYLDLADLRKKLVSWQSSFDSFDDMVVIRHDHYEPLLPDVDTNFRELDSRLRLRRRGRSSSRPAKSRPSAQGTAQDAGEAPRRSADHAAAGVPRDPRRAGRAGTDRVHRGTTRGCSNAVRGSAGATHAAPERAADVDARNRIPRTPDAVRPEPAHTGRCHGRRSDAVRPVRAFATVLKVTKRPSAAFAHASARRSRGSTC
jgi:tetratricopeptide (TPR) repeat protein